jgi:primosomal protein N' (replication factor Y)
MQTYAPDHYAIQAAARHDYEAFYRQEMAFRRKMGYPPFRRLARLLYTGAERTCRDATARMKERLTKEVVRRRLVDVRLIGPAPAFFSRLRGKHRWQILVLAPDPVALLRGVGFPPPWQVDVDPVDVL